MMMMKIEKGRMYLVGEIVEHMGLGKKKQESRKKLFPAWQEQLENMKSS